MNCSQIQQQMDDYLDGELTEKARGQVDRHLGECLACRREYESLRSLVDKAGELDPEIQPSRDFWPAILARIGKSRSLEPSWWLQLAAAGLVLAVLSVPIVHLVGGTSRQLPLHACPVRGGGRPPLPLEPSWRERRTVCFWLEPIWSRPLKNAAMS